MKKKFNHKILIVGYGAVSQCTLPILLEKIDVPLKNLTIIDFEDKSKALKKYIDEGHFKPGSMLPKIKAVVRFLEAGGKQAIITSPESIERAINGKTGTYIIR